MIDEHDVVRLLEAATEDIAVPARQAQVLAAARSRRRRRRVVVGGLASVAALAVVAVAAAGVVHSRSGTTPVASPTGSATDGSCTEPVPSRVLPAWARTGFSDPRPRAQYVMGDRGSIVAILFATPLTSPPSADHNNKILWVAHATDGSPLHITGSLPDGSASVTRVVDGGPGPSIIDLPRPGCWHFTLQWGGGSDSLDLAYLTP